MDVNIFNLECEHSVCSCSDIENENHIWEPYYRYFESKGIVIIGPIWGLIHLEFSKRRIIYSYHLGLKQPKDNNAIKKYVNDNIEIDLENVKKKIACYSIPFK